MLLALVEYEVMRGDGTWAVLIRRARFALRMEQPHAGGVQSIDEDAMSRYRMEYVYAGF